MELQQTRHKEQVEMEEAQIEHILELLKGYVGLGGMEIPSVRATKIHTILDRIRHILDPQTRRGQPQRTKYFRDHEDFRTTMVALIREADAQGKEPSEAYIAALLLKQRRMSREDPSSATEIQVQPDSTTRLLRSYLKRYGYGRWEELIALARMHR